MTRDEVYLLILTHNGTAYRSLHETKVSARLELARLVKDIWKESGEETDADNLQAMVNDEAIGYFFGYFQGSTYILENLAVHDYRIVGVA